MNKKGEATRQMIKEKTYTLFAEYGFKKVTMKDICETTGLSRGGLYCHYGSTKQIFAEIVEDLLGQQDQEFTAMIDRQLPAVDILDQVLMRYEKEMLDSDGSLSLAIYEYYSMQEIRTTENTIKTQYDLSAHMWNRLLQYGIDKKEFKQVDIQAVFDLIVFSYQGVRMYSKLMPIGQELPGRICREIRKLLVVSE